MGTMLYARGRVHQQELRRAEPDAARPRGGRASAEYVRAGADIIETNTFGANRIKLGSFGLADKLHAINVEGVRIARRAAGDQAYVAGAIGPLGIRIEPWGKTGVDEAREYFREQARRSLEGGVDLFILETFRDLNEIGAAIDAVRSVSDLPIIAQMTTEEDGNTLDGTPPERFAPELERRGATIIGVNCAVGPAPMLETIERMEAVTRLRLSAQPNAGKPRDVEGRNIYLCSPEYMASYARRFILHNVRVVGGCCGTTPEHIRQIKAAVRASRPVGGAHPPARGGPAIRLRRAAPPPATVTAPPVPREQKSRLARELARGAFVLGVELLPPRGFEAEPAIQRARELKRYGIDVVNIPDGLRAGARLSALSLAVLIEQQAGIETLLHYSCRDRNLLGIQSDLLGAHAMGLRNLLLITGDPGRVGDYPDATAVFDVDSIGLTNVVSRLNHGCDVGGQPIGAPTAFHIGVSVNPGGVEPRRGAAAVRVQGGGGRRVRADAADFRRGELRAVPEAHRIGAAADRRRHVPVRERAKRRVHGERSARRPRARRADGPDAARGRPGQAAAAEGVAIAREIAVALRSRVQGIQVSTASGNIDAALAVVDGLR